MDVGDLVGGRTPEGAGIDPDRDFVRWLKVLVGRGTPEGEDIRSGRDSVGGILLVPEGGENTVRQRERISARARTPSGDTTKVP